MEPIKLDYREKSDNGLHISLPKSQFEKFSASLLGLGDIASQPSGTEKFDALAAVFDLQGFTSFFDVRDPQTTVPDFIDRFLCWFFDELKSQFTKRKIGEDVLLWTYLPVFAKFMGDGVLLIWRIPKDERSGGALAIGNIVARLHQITRSYRDKFLPSIINDFRDPPPMLRCGGAFGQVMSVGNECDFIGPCINVASRLQKFAGLSFAFSRHGCDPAKCFRGQWKDMFVQKKARLRGIAKEELILVEKEEFSNLPRESQSSFG